MPIKFNAFRGICATCKHLQAVEKGREFDKIVDTEFTTFSCNILGWKKKEFYLMAGNDSINHQKKQECQYWEEWHGE
ncbi:MAG: hypothetical protein ACLFQV_01435 [Vulcanimicrobiota bacterium]